jgi:hypothetical protein
MKQTAVDFAVEQLEKLIPSGNQIIIGIILEKSKEMEKNQKIEFANNYGFHICGYDYENAEQYYMETY